VCECKDGSRGEEEQLACTQDIHSESYKCCGRKVRCRDFVAKSTLTWVSNTADSINFDLVPHLANQLMADETYEAKSKMMKLWAPTNEMCSLKGDWIFKKGLQISVATCKLHELTEQLPREVRFMWLRQVENDDDLF